MSGFVNMAKSQLSSGNNQLVAKYLENIESGLKQMSVILHDLLTYSRPETLNFEKECINHLLEQSICMFEKMANDKNIDIIKHFSNDSVYIIPGLLPGVFNNIIKNAIQATDSGTIYIKTDLFDNTLSVSIRDTGPGIPERYLNDIFKPFFTTKNREGTGLGLAISKEIVEDKGGTISAVNHPQGGCEFEICIPVDYNY